VCGLPYRMTEANSCSHGGMEGVSDAYASALWVIDLFLQGAQAGFSGINIHGGGLKGVYSPIVGDPTIGYTARPITHGLRLANQFAGAQFATSKFNDNGCNGVAYAAHREDELLIAIVNKDEKAIKCSLNGDIGSRTKKVELLRAPRLDSKTRIELRALAYMGKRFFLPPYTALLIRNVS